MRPHFFGRWDDEAWSFGWLILALVAIVCGFAVAVGSVVAALVCMIGTELAPGSSWFEGDAFFYWAAAVALPCSAYCLGLTVPRLVESRDREQRK